METPNLEIDCPHCKSHIKVPWVLPLRKLLKRESLDYEMSKATVEFAYNMGYLSDKEEEELLVKIEKSVVCTRCGGNGREPIPFYRDKISGGTVPVYTSQNLEVEKKWQAEKKVNTQNE